MEIYHVKCADCKRPLTLRRRTTNTRCRTCYQRHYQGKPGYVYRGENNSKSRSPEEQAEIERRVAIYAERAARGEPLFEDMEYIWDSIPRSA